MVKIVEAHAHGPADLEGRRRPDLRDQLAVVAPQALGEAILFSLTPVNGAQLAGPGFEQHAAMQTTTAEKIETESKEKLAQADERAHLYEMLKEFSTLMVATYDKTGKHPRLNARPLHVAKLEDDCSLVFVTALPSEKVAEAQRFDGNVIGQSIMRQVSLYGHFEISTDRERIAKVWSKGFDVWFPEGKDDPNACLMIFVPRDAELWDSSGLKGLRYLFDSARALLTKTVPEAAPDQHAKLKLNRA